MDIWRHQELHPQLLKLLSMWDGIFPKQLLDRMHHIVKQTSAVQTSGRQNIPPTHHSAQAAQQGKQWRPTAGAAPLQTVPTYPSHGTSTTGRDTYATVQQPAYLAAMPPASVQYGGPVNGYSYPGGNGGHMQRSWQQQPAALQSHLVQPQVQPSSQSMVLPNLLSSLLSSGLLSVQQPVSLASVPSAAPAVLYTHPQSRAGTPEAVNAEDCKFVPSRLKVLLCLPSSPLIHVCSQVLACLLINSSLLVGNDCHVMPELLHLNSLL